MERVLVVGSGASGVHFAQTLLERGRHVTMVDAGIQGAAPVEPSLSLNGLKEELPDPAAYFLGDRFQSVELPENEAEYYGFPPHKDYIFEVPRGYEFDARGFAPLFSFARGGLANAWTGGSHPLNDAELDAFPFGLADLEPHYATVARRIGITGEDDDLARFMPLHDGLLEPLEFDQHSERLMTTYRRKRAAIHRLRCYLGRTRVAVLSRELAGRKPCGYLGRCLWGCPTESLYTPTVTLRECVEHPNFEYVPGLIASHFRTRSGRVTALVAHAMDGGEERELPVDTLALAAGTLASSKILLHSVYRDTGEVVALPGLMDNRQVMVPFVNLGMIGQQFRADRYQYHQLGLTIENDDPRDNVHGQITTLKTALLHPVIQPLPFDLRTSIFLARSLHAALGLVNANFRDTRRSDNQVTLVPGANGAAPKLGIRYAPDPGEPARVKSALRRLRKLLWKFGCIVPPGMAHVRPMGASVHYAGTVPMTTEAAPWTATPDCRSREFDNLFLVDGATFPFLPAKNLTFTLMANAVRVASNAL